MLRFLRQRRYAWDSSTCSAAAGAGHLDCLRYAREEDKAQCPWDAYTIVAAAYGGHEDVLRYALKNCCPISLPWWARPDYGSSSCGEFENFRGPFEAAVAGKQRAAAETLLVYSVPFTEGSVRTAALMGDLWALKCCHAIHDGPLRDLGYWAARGGSVPCLEYARACGCVMGPDVLRGAVEGRSLQCLVYAHENGIPIENCLSDTQLCITAATSGSPDCLAYVANRVPALLIPDVLVEAIKAGSEDCVKLYAERAPMVQIPYDDGAVCDLAASRGSVVCLRVAHEYGYAFSTTTCTKAVMCGSIDCLKYAHESGAPWDWSACAEAAKHGSLSCLQYLHSHGCPWDTATCCQAAANDKLSCLVYAHKNGCPWSESVCVQAAIAGSTRCLKYAHENGCPWNSSVYLHSSSSRCFSYAVSNGCPRKRLLCTKAAEYGRVQILEWMHTSGFPWDSSCLLAAARCDHLDCFLYADANGCPRSIEDDRVLWNSKNFLEWYHSGLVAFSRRC